MAEALKHHLNSEVVAVIAQQINNIHAEFNSQAFIAAALKNFDRLELMQRAKHIAATLHQHLPSDYPSAIAILVASLGPKLPKPDDNGMKPFMYLPHVFFVSQYGLDFFEESMAAQYEITQRFTAEFSIRPFIQKYPQKSLALLKRWARDPSVHVRRLVSEGTRPRLPWAQRLPEFQRDPSPVLPLLELLKNDPELYVRRSVANHLNDIGKDNPAVLLEIAERWMQNPSAHTRWLVKHALRFAVKAGDARALAILGFGQTPHIKLANIQLSHNRLQLGETLQLAVCLHNSSTKPQALMVDLAVHYANAKGSHNQKIFKFTSLSLSPREQVNLTKKLPMTDKSTRKHYPGEHRLELLINGKRHPLGSFILQI